MVIYTLLKFQLSVTEKKDYLLVVEGLKIWPLGVNGIFGDHLGI